MTKYEENIKWLKKLTDPIDWEILDSYTEWVIEELDQKNVQAIINYMHEKCPMYDVDDIIVCEPLILHYSIDRFKEVWERMMEFYGDRLQWQIACNRSSELYCKSLTDIFMDMDRVLPLSTKISGTLADIRYICKEMPETDVDMLISKQHYEE